MPGEPHRWARGAFWKFISDDRPFRRSLGICTRRLSLNRHRVAQFEREESEVHVVTPHIAERASSKIPKHAPGERHTTFVKLAPRRGTQPKIPVESFGHSLARWTFDALRPNRTICPHVNFL